ncbi:uncharacterized protein LOC133687507 isoform X1 [Populus nigra]|uniref:uncharacterized protein LOC133687507 isoform X1 n=1 Tax=Populus nigra TaxID=3691 RepID=UPI002B26FD72|nr:uncharacterized protein LOC133687507 isoform X1 [Populus nigra]
MSSTPKRRPKPDLSSRSSHPSTISSKIEPPHNLFPSKQEFLRLIAVLAIASSVALTCNFIANYIDHSTKPFCDTNLDSSDSLSNSCEPCPRNGECNQGKLECARGYRRHRNTCIEDGDVYERAKKLMEGVENHLCEAYADFLCYGTGIMWVQEDDILNDLDGHQLLENYSSDNPVYVYTKMKAMETISEELQTRTNPNGKKEFKCPDLLVEHYKPFTCHLRQWISEHALVIVPVCALVLGFAFLVWKIRRRWYLSTRGEELYHQVCDILEERALMSKRVNAECEPWVVASRLRDHLLSPKERKDFVLWKKVEDLVREDSRVDRYPKLVKGESKVVWEWQVEGSLSSGRMRKKVESSKLKSNDGVKENFDKERHELKPEPKILMF